MAKKYPTKDEWKYSSFWYKDFDGMAKKTMLRQLISKWGVMSIEMQTAFLRDETSSEIANNGEIDVVDLISEGIDNLPEETKKIENKAISEPKNDNATEEEKAEFDFFAEN